MGAMLPNDYKNVNVALQERYGLIKKGELKKSILTLPHLVGLGKQGLGWENKAFVSYALTKQGIKKCIKG
jgi:hypothetical protein